MQRVFEKFIEPAAPKIIAMMSRQTQNTMDNQKPGTAEAWKKLKEVFDKKWVEEPEDVHGDNPYEQKGDMSEIKNDIRYGMYTIDSNGNKKYIYRRNNGNSDGTNNIRYKNHMAQIYEIYNSTIDDAGLFATEVSKYCAGYKETAWIVDQLEEYISGEDFDLTKEQVLKEVEYLLTQVD